MIHSFVELALPVDDLLSARSEFLDLGFTELRVTDAWSHPYTALRLGQLSIGLHQGFVDTPSLVLTRPSLASSIWSATHARDWTQIQLDDDLFNFARCDSPTGFGRGDHACQCRTDAGPGVELAVAALHDAGVDGQRSVLGTVRSRDFGASNRTHTAADTGHRRFAARVTGNAASATRAGLARFERNGFHRTARASRLRTQ